MLSLALVTSNALAAQGIEQLAEESGLFKLVFKGSPNPAAIVLRAIVVNDPDVILLDVGDWETASAFAKQLKDSNFRAVTVGFRPAWSQVEQMSMAEAGISDLIPDPFSIADLEAAVYEALHRKRPVTHENILAFLPAKAGGGCSTVALNTAAAVANSLNKSVLLIEADRRSGVLSIILNLKPRFPLPEVLARIAEMSAVDWHQQYVSAFGMHMLLADPSRQSQLPTWGDFYQLLRYVQKQYDFVFVDLPEVVNQASAELVRSARGVFVVCTPEIPSLKMAAHRCAELQACEIPKDNVHIVVNRWESGRLSIKDIEGILERPVFGTVANDYSSIKDSIRDSRLVATDSNFGKGCRLLAQKLSGLPEASLARSTFDLLKKLGRIAR
jgi:pilus assembly protein CpaE